jgi:hypothetical protein
MTDWIANPAEEARLRKLAEDHGYTVQFVPYAGTCVTKDGVKWFMIDRIEGIIAEESRSHSAS